MTRWMATRWLARTIAKCGEDLQPISPLGHPQQKISSILRRGGNFPLVCLFQLHFGCVCSQKEISNGQVIIHSCLNSYSLCIFFICILKRKYIFIWQSFLLRIINANACLSSIWSHCSGVAVFLPLCPFPDQKRRADVQCCCRIWY